MLPLGKHVAKVGEINGNKIVVYETDSGALCAAIPCEIAEGEGAGEIGKHTVTLATKDGTIQTKTCDNLKEVFGWDGADPFWLMDANLTECRFQIVVEEDEYDGNKFNKIKWLNPLGGAQKMPEAADRRSVLAKYGSKFRALAGGTAPKPATAAPAKTPAKSAPPAAPKKATPPPTPTGPTATMEECWAELCKANEGKSQDDLSALWFATLIQEFGTDNNSDLNPHQWGALKAKLEDNVPM